MINITASYISKDEMNRFKEICKTKGFSMSHVLSHFIRQVADGDMDIGMKNFMQNGPRVPAEFLHE